MERRLTAILSADVVGYSRLMGADEVGTLERLKACRRELIDPVIEEFHDRIIKLMGDGALVEFASVVDAVQCAAVIQRKMARQGQGITAAQRIQFRVGINLGDVIVEGDDIYGDGVKGIDGTAVFSASQCLFEDRNGDVFMSTCSRHTSHAQPGTSITQPAKASIDLRHPIAEVERENKKVVSPLQDEQSQAHAASRMTTCGKLRTKQIHFCRRRTEVEGNVSR